MTRSKTLRKGLANSSSGVYYSQLSGKARLIKKAKEAAADDNILGM
jgi:hypothetical protein